MKTVQLQFGSGELVASLSLFDNIRSKFPNGDIVSCSIKP